MISTIFIQSPFNFFQGSLLSKCCLRAVSPDSPLNYIRLICETFSLSQFSLTRLETKLEMDTASHTSKVQWRAVEDHLTKENKVQKKGVWQGLDQRRVNGTSL